MNIKKTIMMTLMAVPLLSSCNLDLASGTIKVKDMLGTEVTVPKNPKKVACISRTTYDLLVAFGLGDNIDGAYSGTLNNKWMSNIYPNYTKHHLYGYNDSVETFLSRGVDLVFAPEKYIADNLREHGVNALCISLYGNPTFDNYVNFFADVTSTIWTSNEVKSKANKWKEDTSKAINDVKNELAKHEIKQKKIFYVRGDKDNGVCYTDTIGSFTEYAYRSLGFNYVTYTVNRPSKEEILNEKPDVFVCGGIYQRKNINNLYTDIEFKELDAVKNNNVYNIPIGLTAFEQLSCMTPIFFYDQANKIYPEYFSYDISKMIKDTIKNEFNVTLTDTQVSYMKQGLGPNGEELV